MSDQNPESPSGREHLTTDEFFKTLESAPGEAFHIVGGEIGVPGDTTVVHLTDHHGPVSHLLETYNREPLARDSLSGREVELAITIGDDFKSDHDQTEWFRTGYPVILHHYGEEVRVRLVSMGSVKGSGLEAEDNWIYVEPSDKEQGEAH